jgi:hypothetical protein
MAIENTMTFLKLTPGKYDAVHCRVTHPAFRGMTTVDGEMLAADEQGAYEFIGDNKKAAVEAAIHGVLCVSWIRNLTLPTENTSSEKDSVYLFSDSHKLVRFMVAGQQDLSNEINDNLSLTVAQLQSQFRIVGRCDTPVAHMQNVNENTPFDSFVSTFVDIYIASKAKCLGLGVGNYAHLSTKINSVGNMCLVRHQNVARKVMLKWGMREQLEVPLCPV